MKWIKCEPFVISQKKRVKHERQFSMLHQESHNHYLCISSFQLLININRARFGDLTSLCQHTSNPISDKYQRQLYKYLIWWRLDYQHKLLTADSLYLRLLSLRPMHMLLNLNIKLGGLRHMYRAITKSSFDSFIQTKESREHGSIKLRIKVVVYSFVPYSLFLLS